MDHNIKLGSEINSTLVDKKRYQYLVGKLIFLVQIKPYIVFIVSAVNQLMNDLAKKLIAVLFGILKYYKEKLRNWNIYVDID